ncbi:bactofilin family protein [Polynucleobacter sphagniphilus]|jgi:cytoskeletal protein CcmA (bactofilin family)|uniref:bactofilin family protein n=1 Tax=Polynucleobacter sphagniphilus TaxID=1743169 RepID=UPI002474A63D|nr:polymer-forming cytoskeletal protein [Polynucleobacter sphagniphilus]MDH6301046.1 cytoskeletal protein CcmA (bactofilin family) [Polynucleobacter sphagniphilus]
MSTNQNPYRQSEQNIDEDNVLLLGKNFNIVGDLIGQGTVIVSGKIEGNINSNRTVSEVGSSIVGNIECKQLDISGSVKGLIQASNVIIRKGALVEGEVHYATLAMEQGCEVLGKLKKISEKQVVSKAESASLSDFNPTAETILLNFPDELKVQLQDLSVRAGATLTLIDGSQAPLWVNLTKDKLGMLVNGEELQSLRNRNETLQLRLNVGGTHFDFSLPL